MTGVWLAWAIGMGFAAWNNGLNPRAQGGLAWPPPYVFLDPTILFGGIALLGRWNPRVAGLLALGLVVPLILVQLNRPGGNPLVTLPFYNPSLTPAQRLQQAGGEPSPVVGPNGYQPQPLQAGYFR